MTMEGRCGPKGSLSAPRFLEVFKDLLFLHTRDEGLPSCPLFRDKTINAVQIERSDDLLYRTFTKIEGPHCLVPGTTRQEEDNHNAPTIGLLIPSTHGRMEIGQRCVLGIGNEMPLSHDSYVTT